MTLAINWIFTTGFHSKRIQLDLHTDIEAVLRWLLKLIPDCFFQNGFAWTNDATGINPQYWRPN